MSERRSASAPSGDQMRNAWKSGWKADAETMSAAPRWSLGKSQMHKDPKTGMPDSKIKTKTYLQNTRFTIGGGYRDTWVQVLQRNNRTPGPGHYKKETAMPIDKCSGPDYLRTTNGPVDGKNYRDEFNVNNTKAERAPKYTFRGTPPQGADPAGRFTVREVSMEKVRVNCLKPSYMQVHSGASNSVKVTPGPGHYTQPTTFGAASGGSREHYFPSAPPPKQRAESR